MTEPKCKEKILKGENIEESFCYAEPTCHFCSDPYDCTIPHYLKHLLKIKHKEDEE